VQPVLVAFTQAMLTPEAEQVAVVVARGEQVDKPLIVVVNPIITAVMVEPTAGVVDLPMEPLLVRAAA
jgi:hypothetical protein